MLDTDKVLANLKVALEKTRKDLKDWKSDLLLAEDDVYWMRWNILLGPEYATRIGILEECIAIIEDEDALDSDLIYLLRAGLLASANTGSHPSVSMVENMTKTEITKMLNSRQFWDLKQAVLG